MKEGIECEVVSLDVVKRLEKVVSVKGVWTEVTKKDGGGAKTLLI